jgi:hypothetical protein
MPIKQSTQQRRRGDKKVQDGRTQVLANEDSCKEGEFAKQTGTNGSLASITYT